MFINRLIFGIMAFAFPFVGCIHLLEGQVTQFQQATEIVTEEEFEEAMEQFAQYVEMEAELAQIPIQMANRIKQSSGFYGLSGILTLGDAELRKCRYYADELRLTATKLKESHDPRYQAWGEQFELMLNDYEYGHTLLEQIFASPSILSMPHFQTKWENYMDRLLHSLMKYTQLAMEEAMRVLQDELQ